MASRYWVGGTAAWDATAGTKWATTSGGAGGAAVPTSSDDVFLDGNSGTGTVTLGSNQNCKSLDCTGYTGTLDGSASVFSVNSQGAAPAGNIKFSTGMTLTNCGVSWSTNAGGTLTTNGKTIAKISCGFAAGTGAVTLGDACTVAGQVGLTSGTLDTNGKTCNWGSFSSTNSNTRTLTLGASVITITGTGTSWDCSTSTNLTVNADTSSITLTGAGATFNVGNTAGGGKTFYDVSLTGTGTMTLAGTSTYHNLTRTGSTSDDRLIVSNAFTVTNLLTITGLSQPSPMSLTSSAINSTRTITAASVSLTNVNIRDITGAGAASWTGTSLGDMQGNSGITFDTPVTRYWIGDTGNWSDAAHWSATSGGSGGASVPRPQDTAIWNANSFTGNTKTVTFDRLSVCALDWSAQTRTGIIMSFSTGINAYGSIIGMGTTSASVAWTGNVTVNLLDRRGTSGTPTVLANLYGGATLPSPTFGGGSINNYFQLQGNLGGTVATNTWLGNVILTSGTLDLNGYNFNTRNIVATGTATRELQFNSGTITINAASGGVGWNAAATGLTVQSTSGVIIVRQATAAVTFTGGGLAYPTLRQNVAGAVGGITILDTGNSFADIEFSDASNARTLTLTAGTTTTIRSSTPFLNLFGTSGKLMTVKSATAASPATLDFPNGAASSDYLVVQDITATTNPWYAGSHSTDGTGNTNVLFSNLVASATGSLTLGGTAGTTSAATASANLTISGTGVSSSTATGTLTMTGAATPAAAASATGTVTLAAAAPANAAASATGVLALSATGPAGVTATATGALALTASAVFSTTATGSMTLAGTTVARAAATAAAALALSGAATPSTTATASVTLGASATARAATSATGSVALTGSAIASSTATGALILTATTTASARATATGALTLSGTATSSTTAIGSVSLSGAATANAQAAATGALTLAGTVTAAGAASSTGTILLAATSTTATPATLNAALTITGASTALTAASATGSVNLTASATSSSSATATGALALTGTAPAGSSTIAAATITLTATGQAAVLGNGNLVLIGTATPGATGSGNAAIDLSGTSPAGAQAAVAAALTLVALATPSATASAQGTLVLTGTMLARALAVALAVLELDGNATAHPTGTVRDITVTGVLDGPSWTGVVNQPTFAGRLETT